MGKLWIVGQSLGPANTWEFQGVYDTEEGAAAACKNYRYFIAPAMLNVEIPDEHLLEWEGLRWPFGEVTA